MDLRSSNGPKIWPEGRTAKKKFFYIFLYFFAIFSKVVASVIVAPDFGVTIFCHGKRVKGVHDASWWRLGKLSQLRCEI